MSLLEKTRAALAATSPFSGGDQSLTVDDGGQRLCCDLTGLDSLGCAFLNFAVHSDALADATIDAIREVGKRLAAKLTYLLEPIAPIESDAERCVVQMRSNPPQRDEQRTSYYELLVRRGGELSLRRWTQQPGDSRQPLPAHVTREVFLRLVADFSAAA